MPIIHCQFDSGNIEVVDLTHALNPKLRIRKDAGGQHAQWFHFEVLDARGQDLKLDIVEADQVSYPAGWVDYQACASYDGALWFRVPTHYDGKTLRIEHRPESDAVFYAYFAPYSWARHQALIAEALESPHARAETLCLTPEGRPLTLLTLGEAAASRAVIWIIARQHPGETMAEWWVEGFVERLLDPEDAVARSLLRRAVFHVVPNMNPDGSVRGHLRVNACGRNLNRCWREPGTEQSPEVFYVRQRMHATGVDLALDVHGDEGLPYTFIAGAEGVPRWTPAMQAELDAFKALYAEISPDFQTEHGYPLDAPGSADLRKATDYIAETFGCLAVTLEMPFKDTANAPLPELGWSPGRAQRLGAACLDVLHRYLPRLRPR